MDSEHSFLISGGGKSEIMTPPGSGSGEDPPPGSDGRVLTLSSEAARGWELWAPSSFRTRIPALPSRPNRLPKAPPPSAITLDSNI